MLEIAYHLLHGANKETLFMWSGVAISSCSIVMACLYLPQSEGGMTSSQLCLERSHCEWWPNSSLWTRPRVYTPQTGLSGGLQEIRRLSPGVRGIFWRLLTWLTPAHIITDSGHWCIASSLPGQWWTVCCWCWLGHWARQGTVSCDTDTGLGSWGHWR